MSSPYAEITWQDFEDLCRQLLFREGYRDIQSTGRPHEKGADAVCCLDSHRGRGLAVWQFKRWTGEYSDDDVTAMAYAQVEKLQESGRCVSKYTIVIARDIGPKLRDEFAQGQHLPEADFITKVYDQEWLELRLNLESQDLRLRYFGVPLENHTPDSLPATCAAATRQAARVLEEQGSYIPSLYVRRGIDDEIERYLGAGERPVFFVVDTAGSGKTCLACHFALDNVGVRPVLLVRGGALDLTSNTALAEEILRQLNYEGVTSHGIASVFSGLGTCLHQMGDELIVVIDAINEARSPEGAREGLIELTQLAEKCPMRIVATCRDTSWRLVDDPVWQSRAHLVPSGDFAGSVCHTVGAIPSAEASRAFESYFRHFNVHGSIGAAAWDFFRHPLWLRLFCEAHKDEDVGTVRESRKPDVLEAFWSAKLQAVANKARVAEAAADDLLMRVAFRMLENSSMSVRLDSLVADVGEQVYDRDPSAPTPFYACIDESVLAESPDGTVMFAFDELGEYALALHLSRTWRDQGFHAIAGHYAYLGDERHWWPVLVSLAGLVDDASELLLWLIKRSPPAAAQCARGAKVATDQAPDALRGKLRVLLGSRYRLERERALLALARMGGEGVADTARDMLASGQVREGAGLAALGLSEYEDAIDEILEYGRIALGFPHWDWFDTIQTFSTAYRERLRECARDWALNESGEKKERGIAALAFFGGDDSVEALREVIEDARYLGKAGYALAAIGSDSALEVLFVAARSFDHEFTEQLGRRSGDEDIPSHKVYDQVRRRTGFRSGIIRLPLARRASRTAVELAADHVGEESHTVRYLARSLLGTRTEITAVRGLVSWHEEEERRADGPTWLHLDAFWSRAAGREPPRLPHDSAEYLRDVATGHPSASIRCLAIDILGQTRDSDAIPIFYSALASDNLEVVTAGISALGACRVRRAADEIREAVLRGRDLVREGDKVAGFWLSEQAFQTLGYLACDEAVPIILELAEDDGDAHSAYWALGNMRSTAAAEAVGQLVDRFGMAEADWAIRALLRTCTQTGLERACDLMNACSTDVLDKAAGHLDCPWSWESWWFPREDVYLAGIEALFGKCTDEGKWRLVIGLARLTSPQVADTLWGLVQATGGAPASLREEEARGDVRRWRWEAIHSLARLGDARIVPAAVSAISGGPDSRRYDFYLSRFDTDLVADELAKTVPVARGEHLAILVEYLGYVGRDEHIDVLDPLLGEEGQIADLAYEAIDQIHSRGFRSGANRAS